MSVILLINVVFAVKATLKGIGHLFRTVSITAIVFISFKELL